MRDLVARLAPADAWAHFRRLPVERRAAAVDYLRVHGHLAALATTPVGAWLAEQRHLAAKDTLDAARADALTALAPDWRLPHGADWHRKYHLLRAHLGPVAKVDLVR